MDRVRALLWEAVRDRLVADVESGRYPAGALLPSVRELTVREGVSTTTARKALAELVHAGFARTEGTRGHVSKGAKVTTVEDMDRLVAFLRARLDEIDEDCCGANEYGDCHDKSELRHRESEARRLRIETYELAVARQRAELGDYGAWLEGGRGEPSLALEGPDPKLIPGLELALRQDALPFAGHPDFDARWRP